MLSHRGFYSAPCRRLDRLAFFQVVQIDIKLHISGLAARYQNQRTTAAPELDGNPKVNSTRKKEKHTWSSKKIAVNLNIKMTDIIRERQS